MIMRLKKINLPSFFIVFAVIFFAGKLLNRSTTYIGTNSRLIFVGGGGQFPGYVEVRKAYPTNERYWLLGPEPYVYGYYVTVFRAKGVPAEGAVLIEWPSAPIRVTANFESRHDMEVYFDGDLAMSKRRDSWTVYKKGESNR